MASSTAHRRQYAWDDARASAHLLAYMREGDYRPNDIHVTLYLKRISGQFAVYANDSLKFRGIYIPLECCTTPPAGTLYMKLNSPFS